MSCTSSSCVEIKNVQVLNSFRNKTYDITHIKHVFCANSKETLFGSFAGSVVSNIVWKGVKPPTEL